MTVAAKLDRREQYGNAMRIRPREQDILRQIRKKLKLTSMSDPELIRFCIDKTADQIGIKVESA